MCIPFIWGYEIYCVHGLSISSEMCIKYCFMPNNVYCCHLMCICCTMCVLLSFYVYLLYYVCIVAILCVFVVLCVYCCHFMCICCTMCVLLSFYVYLLSYVCIVVILCVFVVLFVCVCVCVCVCIAVLTLDTGLLARSQYSEGPATGHLNTGFSRFPCVYKQMLRWFPRFQVATTCFSCSPLNLNLLVTSFIFYIHVK